MKGTNLGAVTGLRDKNSAESLHCYLTRSHPPPRASAFLILAPANLATGLMRKCGRDTWGDGAEEPGLHLPPAFFFSDCLREKAVGKKPGAQPSVGRVFCMTLDQGPPRTRSCV